jgi:transcriptional regulator with XRE-family HTH domain
MGKAPRSFARAPGRSRRQAATAATAIDSKSSDARRDTLLRVGERLRWLREAYEEREPLHHAQAQWARALRISPEMLNRIELGRTQAPMHVLQRIIYYSGASPAYVLFGVIGDGYMAEWLEAALLAHHATELSTLPKFRELRAMNLPSFAEPAPRLKKGRGRYRRQPPAPE